MDPSLPAVSMKCRRFNANLRFDIHQLDCIDSFYRLFNRYKDLCPLPDSGSTCYVIPLTLTSTAPISGLKGQGQQQVVGIPGSLHLPGKPESGSPSVPWGL